ncbi:ribosomal subunit 39S-domain-containing protein [Daldinia caldariorum]|uniref:ribosomal subunit 39S-domain-containing protein n=1 Tax=Daldinia caldariorum TaxID=326644 RepID=UPI002007E9E5|nr:ribosomal subunit 39S-domain-containing protein [Daldinia caldariorum]KAI1468974.1 ribosomal subunit 39S-domain-containing protein [Daldinia caldariorum]
MKRIPRLRRPSGLLISTTYSPIAPLVGQCTPASQTISNSHRRPIPTTLQRSSSLRFYSTDKQPITQSQSPTPIVEEVPKEEVEVASLAEEEVYEPESFTPTQWQTYVPPPRRSYAERLDDISDPTYVPALTADGLESVGGLRNWWDKPGNWTADFVGFKPLNSVLDPAVLETSVRRAVIEAFALKQAGREDELVKAWPIAGEDELHRLLSVEISVAPDGAVSLTGDVSAVLDSLVQKSESTVSEESVGESTSVPVPSAEQAQKYKGAWGHGWKAVSLSDPRIKFAITKRIFQLTGHLVHDHQLSSITDVRSLIHTVQKPPKPKTLTEEIQERRQDLVQIPNVSFATKRITRGDREKAVGRFKLIEEELKKRDLPLVGHGFVSKNKEMSRFRGGV